MKAIAFLALLAAAVLPCLAQNNGTANNGTVNNGTIRVVYNPIYDNSSWPLNKTTCSKELGGMWPTLESVPSFPFVGSIPIPAGSTGSNSSLCGSCWGLAYNAPDGSLYGVTITAVDVAANATVSVGKSAFVPWKYPPEGVNATLVPVSPAACGMIWTDPGSAQSRPT